MVPLLNAIFPDECRICEAPLSEVRRYPVCSACLSLPQPHSAEFFCRSCLTPFVEAYPLNEHGLCEHCQAEIAGFDTAYAFGSFEGPLQKLIHLLKYSKVESLAGPLGALLLRALPRDGNYDHVMAMPMHWRKRWERGFNQAELLATPVARRFGLKLSTNLQRSRYTKAQAGLDEAGRRDNLKGSFRVKSPGALVGKRVLLIDDVLTTGATLRAAGAALKQAGAKHVTVLTLARVDRRGSFESSGSLPKGQPAREVLAGQEAS